MTTLMLAVFPLIGLVLFRAFPIVMAIPLTLVVGHMLLPSGAEINFPILPSFDRDSVPVLTALVLALAHSMQPSGPVPRGPALPNVAGADVLPGWLPGQAWVRWAILLLLLGHVGTVATNLEPAVNGGRTLPALGPYDALNTLQLALLMLVPFVLGRKFLAGEIGHRSILFVLAVGGLIYSIPALVEAFLSPQFHIWLYGYFPHAWGQHVRVNGFRPLVFMPHGLVLALFLCSSALAIIAYMRAIEGDRRVLYFFAAIYLGVVLFLAKSLGMVLVFFTLLPVAMVFPVRWQLLVAAAIALLVLSYPLMRGVGISPFSYLVDALEPHAPVRAHSLDFRIVNEDRIMLHMQEKPIFGWGGWARAEVFDEEGLQMSVRDGIWLIIFGQSGWVGFVTTFALLTVPIFALALRSRQWGLSLATSGLALIMAANLVDLLPNSGLTILTWMIAGALVGRVELAGSPARDAVPSLAAADIPRPLRSRGPVYARTGLSDPPPVSAGIAAPEDAPFAARMRGRVRPPSAGQADADAGVATARDAPPSAPPGSDVVPGMRGSATSRYSRFGPDRKGPRTA